MRTTPQVQHFEAPVRLKLTQEQQRMEKLWGETDLPPASNSSNDWDNYPDED